MAHKALMYITASYSQYVKIVILSTVNSQTADHIAMYIHSLTKKLVFFSVIL